MRTSLDDLTDTSSRRPHRGQRITARVKPDTDSVELSDRLWAVAASARTSPSRTCLPPCRLNQSTERSERPPFTSKDPDVAEGAVAEPVLRVGALLSRYRLRPVQISFS
jgi:hypothetical protein